MPPILSPISPIVVVRLPAQHASSNSNTPPDKLILPVLCWELFLFSSLLMRRSLYVWKPDVCASVLGDTHLSRVMALSSPTSSANIYKQFKYWTLSKWDHDERWPHIITRFAICLSALTGALSIVTFLFTKWLTALRKSVEGLLTVTWAEAA